MGYMDKDESPKLPEYSDRIVFFITFVALTFVIISFRDALKAVTLSFGSVHTNFYSLGIWWLSGLFFVAYLYALNNAFLQIGFYLKYIGRYMFNITALMQQIIMVFPVFVGVWWTGSHFFHWLNPAQSSLITGIKDLFISLSAVMAVLAALVSNHYKRQGNDQTRYLAYTLRMNFHFSAAEVGLKSGNYLEAIDAAYLGMDAFLRRRLSNVVRDESALSSLPFESLGEILNSNDKEIAYGLKEERDNLTSQRPTKTAAAKYIKSVLNFVKESN